VYLAILGRYPRPDSTRRCITSLTPQGFQDITPDRTHLLQWRENKDIQKHEGYTYIWCGLGMGWYVPPTPIHTLEEGPPFYRAGVTLWKSRGQDLTAFGAWSARYDTDDWDRQLLADVQAGRLDELAEEALRELRGGRSTDL